MIGIVCEHLREVSYWVYVNWYKKVKSDYDIYQKAKREYDQELKEFENQ